MGQQYCSYTPCTEASSDTTHESYKNRKRNFNMVNMDAKQQHVSQTDDSNIIEPPYENLYLFDDHSNSFKLNISQILEESVQTSSNLIQSDTTQQWDMSDIESMENDMEHQMSALTTPRAHRHSTSSCSNLYNESSINWDDDKIDNTLDEMKKEV
eukprot:86235_1